MLPVESNSGSSLSGCVRTRARQLTTETSIRNPAGALGLNPGLWDAPIVDRQNVTTVRETPMKRLTLAFLLAFSGGIGIDDAQAQPLTGIGTLGPDTNGYSYSFPTGVSADGLTVVGESSSDQGTEAFVRTKTDGMVGLGTLGANINGVSFSRASGISSDGVTVIGQSSNQQGYEAFVWTQQTGMIGLGTLLTGGGEYSYPTGVSSDGSTVVGDYWNGQRYDAFVWTVESGMVRLGTPPADGGGYSYSRAAAVSADGMTVVGERTNGSRTIAVVWTKDGDTWLMVDLGTLPTDGGGTSHSRATGVSVDGSRVVGQNINAQRVEAFVWSAATDEMVGLGTLQAGGGFSEATAISADGSTVVGESYNGSFSEAFVWTESIGMIGLGTLGGYSHANGVSADGAMVVGYSAISEGTEAFLWTQETGMIGLGTLGNEGSGFVFSVANGISADGSTVYGHSQNKQGVYEAFVRRAGEEPEATEVTIDVEPKPGKKPKSGKNKINLKSQKEVSVAILTTAEFDASEVDEYTILFGDPTLTTTGGEWVRPIRMKIVDVDRDGDDDVLLVFKTQELVSNGALNQYSELVLLKGETFDGVAIVGTDAVTIVPPPKGPK
ncbi:MAG: hypothetical protein AABP62_26880 [Planctomycetota bacterium]